tara:strand:+ start:228 stop:662 length:435 start_codon:yes stop_codon:yes gene_type:complete
MNDNKKLVVKQNLKIRFDETDALGIVWHGNYLKYFEDGRENFGLINGISYLDAKKNGFATPIVKTTTNHKLTLKYGESATIETLFVNSDSAKLVYRYVIKNEANAVVCNGETIQVFTSLNDGSMSLILPHFIKVWKIKLGLLDA